jgi:hypothetical protein
MDRELRRFGDSSFPHKAEGLPVARRVTFGPVQTAAVARLLDEADVAQIDRKRAPKGTALVEQARARRKAALSEAQRILEAAGGKGISIKRQGPDKKFGFVPEGEISRKDQQVLTRVTGGRLDLALVPKRKQR